MPLKNLEASKMTGGSSLERQVGVLWSPGDLDSMQKWLLVVYTVSYLDTPREHYLLQIE